MIDGGRLVLAGATGDLFERTGTVIVEVGEGAAALAAALAARGVEATAGEGTVEVAVDGDGVLDAIRDACADLGLPLHRMTSRVTSLDEAFLTGRTG
jgi:ABC-2 type transport system ATP-binding protein